MFNFSNISEFLDELSNLDLAIRTALISNEELYYGIQYCQEIEKSIRGLMLKKISTISRDIKILLRKLNLLVQQSQQYNLDDPFPIELKKGIEDYYKDVKKYNLNWQKVYKKAHLHALDH